MQMKKDKKREEQTVPRRLTLMQRTRYWRLHREDPGEAKAYLDSLMSGHGPSQTKETN